MATYKLLLAAVAALIATPAAAQDPDWLAGQRQAQTQQLGAESVEALALLLHQALQANDFDMARRHLVGKEVFDELLQSDTTSVHKELRLYSPANLLQDFQRDFEQVILEGAMLEVDWPNTSVKELIFAAIPPTESPIVFPAQLHLNSATDQPFQVHFNAARLDGRYYLLPPLRLSEAY